MMSTPHGLRPTPHGPGHRSPDGRWRLAAGLAAAALGLCAYLTAAALTGDGRPAGCGPTAGCGAVLTSAWSRVVGVPVVLPAAVLYAAVLAHLLVYRRTGGLAPAVAAGTMLGAAGWFTAVQTVHLGAGCRYCLAAHALAVALAGVLLRDARAPHAAVGLVLGALVTTGVAVVQIRHHPGDEDPALNPPRMPADTAPLLPAPTPAAPPE